MVQFQTLAASRAPKAPIAASSLPKQIPQYLAAALCQSKGQCYRAAVQEAEEAPGCPRQAKLGWACFLMLPVVSCKPSVFPVSAKLVR